MVEPDSTKADDLVRVLSSAKDEVTTEAPNLHIVGVTSDGAANMMGVNHGAVTQFKRANPHIVINKCLNHNAELANKDTLTSAAFKKQYEKLLTGLIGFYYLYK